MKKLLFVLCMVLSDQVAAATDKAIPYSLSPGASLYYTGAHSIPCIPPVNSLESREGNVAAWMIEVGPFTFSVRVINLSTTNQSGIVMLRLGNCQ